MFSRDVSPEWEKNKILSFVLLIQKDSTFYWRLTESLQNIDWQCDWNQQRTMLKINTPWCHLEQILWLPAPQTLMPKKAYREFQKGERYTIFAAHIPDPSDNRFGTVIIGTCIHTLYWASFHKTALEQASLPIPFRFTCILMVLLVKSNIGQFVKWCPDHNYLWVKARDETQFEWLG